MTHKTCILWPAHQNKAFPYKHLAALPTIFIIFLCSVAIQAAPLRTVTATITKITDGDTVQAVTPEGTKLKVRLYGIDAPETPKGNKPGEPFGNASRDYLASLVGEKSVRVEILDIDLYRRVVAILWLAERNVNQEMIAAGMAEASLSRPLHPSGTGCQSPGERGLVPG